MVPNELIKVDAWYKVWPQVIDCVVHLVEQLGEYAPVHLNTASGESFVTKMDALPKIAKGEQM